MSLTKHKLIEFDNKIFEYQYLGQGEQTIVFLNGFRMPFNSWDKVYPQVAQNNKVLLINRLGVGSSSKAQEPQDGHKVVADLQQLLSALHIAPPYVLVAHSLGGLFVNLFARVYGKAISAIVLVDAPHPLEIAEQKRNKPSLILHALNNGFKFVEKIFDRYKFSEDECVATTVNQIDAAQSFPTIPVAVVSGTQKMPFVPAAAFQLHQMYQQKLLDLSTISKHYPCENSGHFPQITEPQKVIEAISDTISAVKTNRHTLQ